MNGDNNVLFAFGLTLFAGLATGVGSAIAFFAKRTNLRFLSISLAFSAGVMLYVSFTEILQKAQAALEPSMGARGGAWVVAASFFGGILVIGIIDRLVPESGNPHEAPEREEVEHLHDPEEPPLDLRTGSKPLMRMGMMAAIAIGIHNFPEGMATFFSALHDPTLGVAIAIAIALHNIPEGISVSVPVYYATGSRRKAFTYSFLSGVSEPIGAFLGYLILRPFFSEELRGILFAAVAGVMVFVSLDELLPAAREYSEGHEPIYGIVAGMAVMALSLILVR